MELIIQLLAGAIGGNAAGAILKDKSLGTIGNTIAGLIGGGLGGQIIAMLTGNADMGMSGSMGNLAGMDIGSLISQIAGGGVGGGVVMIIIGFVKKLLGK